MWRSPARPPLEVTVVTVEPIKIIRRAAVRKIRPLRKLRGVPFSFLLFPLVLAMQGCTASSNTSNNSDPPPRDATAPTAPGGLAASASSSTQVTLSWTASTDNVGVTGYRVERCVGNACVSFAQIAAVMTTSFSDSGLLGGTSYGYRVRATDAAGNLSAHSNVSFATTTGTADTQVPTAPGGVTATASSSSAIGKSLPPLAATSRLRAW